MDRTDENLRAWADKHLLYEARMLERAARLMQKPRRTNMEIESFAIHARCLTEFLWYDPSERHPEDAARAVHFCDDGAWQLPSLDRPPGVAVVSGKTARDVVHLTYGRFGISEEAKRWDAPLIVAEIANALGEFARVALPSRLSDKARQELEDFANRSASKPGPGAPGVRPVATSLPRAPR
jgi:hypothetical protein